MSRGVLLGLVMLSGSVRAAEPERISDCAASSRVDLGDASTPAVKIQPEERLADWAQGREGRSLMVLPRAEFPPGERVKLSVRFSGDAQPAWVEFWLVWACPGYVDSRVKMPTSAVRPQAQNPLD